MRVCVFAAVVLAAATGCPAQTAATVLTDLQRAIADLAAIPPPAVDRVITALNVPNASGATLYADLAACLAAPVPCRVLAVVYTCAQPPAWTPNTTYAFGALVADPAGNYYRLTAVVGQAVSGAAAPAWPPVPVLGSVLGDGTLNWTAEYLAPAQLLCSDAVDAIK